MGYTKYLVSGCITQGHSTHDPGYRYRAKQHQGRFHISSNKKHMLHPACNGIPPKVLLLCCSWGACVPRTSQRLCQLELWLLVGTTMLDRLWARGQTKCNTLLMLATSVFGRILLTTLLCDVLVKVQAGHLMAQWHGMHGSCLVPFVMLTPTILRGRVPSWLRWWLGV